MSKPIKSYKSSEPSPFTSRINMPETTNKSAFLLPCCLIQILLLCFFLMIPTLSSAGEKKKILHIDSYNDEYQWSNHISEGILAILKQHPDIELRTFYMETKRHQSEPHKQQAALKARNLIESWQPDVVIASDDNAAKYLIVPYYLNSQLPFVFCGLNWDASVYGFPSENVTGIVEVAMLQPTIDALKSYAQGTRIGYLASDTISEHKEYANIVQRFDIQFDVRFVKSFTELKQAYLDLQQTTDMVLIQECRSVKGFNHLKMLELVTEHTRVPSGAMQKYLDKYALLTFAKSGQEQGEYAAKTALDILAGKKPADIPLATNKKASIYLNMTIANAMGIKFPIELIRRGHMVRAEQKKLLFINSYHPGYQWSDDIEKGLFKALKITRNDDGSYDDSNSEVKLRIYRMDTKRNTTDKFKAQAALKAKQIVDEWEPDILIASDDNAAKFLIAPYLNSTSIPIVFCGINWSAASYNFQTGHITGMIEVTPALDTLALLKEYAKGERIGYLGTKVFSEEKEIEYFRKHLQIPFTDGVLATNYQEWKQAYIRLQKSVDMLIMMDPSSLHDWNEEDAETFVVENTSIPTGSTGDNASSYTLLGKVKIAEEQGWWAGGAALRILEGTAVKDIPMTTNQHDRLFLNMKLARKLGIKFPLELLEQATLLD